MCNCGKISACKFIFKYKRLGKYLSWNGQKSFFTVMTGLLGVRAHCLDLSSVTHTPGNVTNLWGSKQGRNCVRLRRENKVVGKKKKEYV